MQNCTKIITQSSAKYNAHIVQHMVHNMVVYVMHKKWPHTHAELDHDWLPEAIQGGRWSTGGCYAVKKNMPVGSGTEHASTCHLLYHLEWSRLCVQGWMWCVTLNIGRWQGVETVEMPYNDMGIDCSPPSVPPNNSHLVHCTRHFGKLFAKGWHYWLCTL